MLIYHFWPFGLAFILAVFFYRFARTHVEKRKKVWKAVADEFGLKPLTPNAPSRWGFTRAIPFVGVIGGRNYKLDTHTVGSGKHRKVYTRFEGYFKHPLGLGLSIHKEMFLFSAIAKKFGSQDIEVSDKEFDRKYTIKGDNDYQVMSYLSAARRKSVDDLFETQPHSALSDEKVQIMVRGQMIDLPAMRQHMHTLIRTTEALDR